MIKIWTLIFAKIYKVNEKLLEALNQGSSQ